MAVSRHKRRMMVTISVELAEQLERIRNISGASASGYLASILEELVPMLTTAADAMEEAYLAKDASKALPGLRRILTSAVGQTHQAALQLDDLDAKAQEIAVTSHSRGKRARAVSKRLKRRASATAKS